MREKEPLFVVVFLHSMASSTVFVLPVDPWVPSNITARTLAELVKEGLLHPIMSQMEPEWMVPGDEAEPRPRDGYVVSFVAFHERGFAVPASRFMRELPRHYGVELQNFTPNSIAQAAIFTAVYEGYMGMAPHWGLWLHLFKVELTTMPSGAQGERRALWAGGCML